MELEAGPDPVNIAQPWRMYHTKTLGGDEELRIEMPGNSKGNAVVIGTWSETEKKFKPCLTITSDCNVIVEGDLIVTGEIVKQDGTAQSIRLEEPAIVKAGALFDILKGQSKEELTDVLVTLNVLNPDVLKTLKDSLSAKPRRNPVWMLGSVICTAPTGLPPATTRPPP